MTYNRLLIGAALTFFAATTTIRAQLTPAEDRLVRQTYARLAMASQTGIISDALDAQSKDVAAINARIVSNTLRFEIGAITGGDIAAVMSTPYNNLVTKPSESIIPVNGQEALHMDFDGTTAVKVQQFVARDARWEMMNDVLGDEGWTWPLSKDLPRMEGVAGVTRYAEVPVVVTLGGKSRAYKAMFLFKPGGQTFVLDNIVNMQGALSSMLTRSPYPHIFLETTARNHPAVKAWIDANQVEGSSCTANGISECCDLASLRCGVTKEDTRTSGIKVRELLAADPTNQTTTNVNKTAKPYTYYA